MVDASEGQVFIAVYHSSNSTNLYVSDAEGLNYSFSLDDVVSPADESSWVGGSRPPDIEVHVVRCLCVCLFVILSRELRESDVTTKCRCDQLNTYNCTKQPVAL